MTAARTSRATKAPAKKSTPAKRSAPARSTTGGRSTAKKTTAKKTTAKKTTAKKTTAKRTTAKRTTATKAGARRTSGPTKRTGAASRARAATTAPSVTTAGPSANAGAASARAEATGDAIAMLVADHREVERLFSQLVGTRGRAQKKREDLVQQIVRELSIHSAIEEMAFYPVVRELNADIEKLVLQSLEEHHVVKWIVSELSGLDPAAERFLAKATVLQETVKHHVQEEESELFPMVRKAADQEMLGQIAKALETAKRSAPTRPHPRAPDTPPGNLANPAVGLIDRIRDGLRGAVRS